MRNGWSKIAPFLLGIALGAAAGSWGQRAVFHRAMKKNPKDRLETLNRELGLDAGQKASVSAVLDSKKADMDKLKAETFVRLAAIRKAASLDMEKVLTPAQAARFEAMQKAKPMRINWEAPAAEPGPAP
ncbi:MAG: hypothetical protein ACHQ49_10885 [Elusimicrobiota bacterium]